MNYVNPNTVSAIVNAIAQAEGYGKDPTNNPTRNNNPGDISSQGSVLYYPSPEEGWAALTNMVTGMLSGSSHMYNPNMTLQQVGAQYAADPNWPGNVAAALGVSPSTTLAELNSGAVTPNPGNRNTTTDSTAQTPVYTGVDNSDAALAVQVSGMSVDASQLPALLNAVYPSLVIQTGLDQPAWNEDKGILQVGGRVTQDFGYPVSFQIYFDISQAPLPIAVVLNASISTNQRTMRHVVQKTPTMTGMLIDLWGMEPDMISAHASSGLMANQFGISSFLSLSTVPQNIQESIRSAFWLGDSYQKADTLLGTPGSLRMAARDAFVELLHLFKNNGTVWFRNQAYTGYTSELSQADADAWSPVTGSSTFENAARRNDVMARGAVVMNFRDTQYFGYFKSLTWVQDANKPFSWEFDFVFKVEYTAKTANVL